MVVENGANVGVVKAGKGDWDRGTDRIVIMILLDNKIHIPIELEQDIIGGKVVVESEVLCHWDKWSSNVQLWEES